MKIRKERYDINVLRVRLFYIKFPKLGSWPFHPDYVWIPQDFSENADLLANRSNGKLHPFVNQTLTGSYLISISTELQLQ